MEWRLGFNWEMLSYVQVTRHSLVPNCVIRVRKIIEGERVLGDRCITREQERRSTHRNPKIPRISSRGMEYP
jgi:hypothetical protein